jgi:hypothetical protein
MREDRGAVRAAEQTDEKAGRVSPARSTVGDQRRAEDTVPFPSRSFAFIRGWTHFLRSGEKNFSPHSKEASVVVLFELWNGCSEVQGSHLTCLAIEPLDQEQNFRV